jgi:hypothetical protein
MSNNYWTTMIRLHGLIPYEEIGYLENEFFPLWNEHFEECVLAAVIIACTRNGCSLNKVSELLRKEYVEKRIDK